MVMCGFLFLIALFLVFLCMRVATQTETHPMRWTKNRTRNHQLEMNLKISLCLKVADGYKSNVKF